MKTKIFKNLKEFKERKDRKINGVSKEFAEMNPNYEEENEKNVGVCSINCVRFLNFI